MDIKWINVDWSNDGNNTPSRPTERLAMYEIYKQAKAIKKYGFSPYFTDFEWKLLELDKFVQTVIMPEEEQKAKDNGFENVNLRMVTHKLSDLTGHTPNFISKTFEEIEEKIELREKLGLSPIPEKNEKYVNRKRRKFSKITGE